MIAPYLRNISTLTAGLIAASAVFVSAAAPVSSGGQGQIVQVTSQGQAEIAKYLALRDTFSVGERKLSQGLALASRQAHGKTLGVAAKFASKTMSATTDTTTSVPVVIRGTASKDLLGYIAARGGTVKAVAPSNDRIEASMPVAELEALAARSDVGSVRHPPQVKSNTGSLCTQGYVGHGAKQVVENMGVTGNGVKVGILSDNAFIVAALQSSGDLGPNTTVLSGQAGPDPGGPQEGCAMMEIVQDLVPQAQLFYATGTPDQGESQFALNIIALYNHGCLVMGDDIGYSDEDPFQDGVLGQAINTVVAAGAIYFSSAGNSGNLTNGSSTTWEGDFKDGPTITLSAGGMVVLHDFGGGNTGNLMVNGTPIVDLFWADPLGASTNDYNLFILDITGSVVKGVAMSGDFGMDPFLEVSIYDGNYFEPAAGDMIVIARSTTSSPVAMHVETFGNSALTFGTTGSTHGHNAGLNTQCMAATFWDSAHNGTKPFNGTNNPTEVFSSDGPRKIFFNPDGSAITPGNFRFSTNGGTTLQKPDFTAADGVTTRTGAPGFSPFYGTSAASPHGCGVAALIKSANPALTPAQIHNIMVNTAHGIPTPGWNRDAGFGVLDVSAAIQ
jgi:hypothetical protein